MNQDIRNRGNGNDEMDGKAARVAESECGSIANSIEERDFRDRRVRAGLALAARVAAKERGQRLSFKAGTN